MDTIQILNSLNEKRVWVEEHLEPLLISANAGVEAAEYRAHFESATMYINEVVELTFKGGGSRIVNVTGDSLTGIVKDVMKQGHLG